MNRPISTIIYTFPFSRTGPLHSDLFLTVTHQRRLRLDYYPSLSMLTLIPCSLLSSFLFNSLYLFLFFPGLSCLAQKHIHADRWISPCKVWRWENTRQE